MSVDVELIRRALNAQVSSESYLKTERLNLNRLQITRV
jgi:hypothetical protein